MTKEQAKDYAKGQLDAYLHSHCGIENTYKPFHCLCTGHRDSTPSMSFDRERNKVHCFGCGADMDIFDLVGEQYGIEDNAARFEKVYELLNIKSDSQDRQAVNTSRKSPVIVTETAKIKRIKEILDRAQMDAKSPKTAPFLQRYLQSRGISMITAERFNIGYIDDFHAIDKTNNRSVSFQVVIIPTGEHSFKARNINPCDKANRYRNEGSSEIFNAAALKKQSETIFIVEGEFDAMSIEECGYSAVALGSTANVRKFLRLCSDIKPLTSFIVCLDNDDSGKKAGEELHKGLKQQGLHCISADLYGTYKDANERLIDDRSGLEIALVSAVTACRDKSSEALSEKPNTPRKTFETISAADLLEMDLPPIRYTVENLLPQGLTILASPPKYGKSWLVLDLCLSVASGSPFLNKSTLQSEALYLALEDSKNRLQERIKKVLNNKKPSSAFKIATDAPTLGNGLMEWLNEYIKLNPATKLIVIDTLQKIRGNANKNETAYSNDYKEIGCLKKFADDNALSLLLVHHLRKMGDDTDVFMRISGTNGISGAADTMLALSKAKRSDDETTLSITGRDVEQNDFLIQFDKNACKWILVGDAEEEAERREINQYNENPIVRTIRHILAPTGIWVGTASDLLRECMEFAGTYETELLTSASLSKTIRKIQKLLFDIDKITYTPPGPNGGAGGRKHTFKDNKRKTLYD